MYMWINSSRLGNALIESPIQHLSKALLFELNWNINIYIYIIINWLSEIQTNVDYLYKSIS